MDTRLQGNAMTKQDALREQRFADLDAVEATAKRLVGDQSREARQRQIAIVDGVNALRHIVGTIPGRPAPPTADSDAHA
jgi:hypothetical protein